MAAVGRVIRLSAIMLIAFTLPAGAQSATTSDSQLPSQSTSTLEPQLEIYGFVEGDAIADLKRNNPDWYDTNRPTMLPAFAREFGRDGHFYESPRASRFGVTSTTPTSNGDVKATIEFDMVGTGPNAGLTTIRLRHAWGQWRRIGAGQTFSEFMDSDVYPNRLDVWGPNGMPTSRNPQVFWEPYRRGDSNVRIAVERPGATADGGEFADTVELRNVRVRSPLPDVTGHLRAAGSRGYVQIGGVIQYIAFNNVLPDQRFSLNGHVLGWGTSVSSNVQAGEHDLLRLQAVYGHAIQNYINDAPIDVGVKLNVGNPVTPIEAEALPVVTMVAYLEHDWSSHWLTSAGYSLVDVNNSDGQLPSAFRIGQYATANLRWTLPQNVMIGGEFQWAQRRNFSDGWVFNGYRVEFSFKYSFSYTLGSSSANQQVPKTIWRP